MLMSKKTGASILEYARPSRGTQIINKITNRRLAVASIENEWSRTLAIFQPEITLKYCQGRARLAQTVFG